MGYPIKGKFHSDDAKSYPAEVIHDYAGMAALDVHFPKGHAFEHDTNLLHVPSDDLDRVFTANGAKRSKRSLDHQAATAAEVKRARALVKE